MFLFDIPVVCIRASCVLMQRCINADVWMDACNNAGCVLMHGYINEDDALMQVCINSDVLI